MQGNIQVFYGSAAASAKVEFAGLQLFSTGSTGSCTVALWDTFDLVVT